MVRNLILSAFACTLFCLFTPSEAKSWGAAHVGYTHVGPNGIYHAGATAVRTPYGSGYHYGTAGVGGYHYGAAGVGGYGAAGVRGYDYRYTPSYYGGYRYGYIR